jgi:hypothetical protein
MTVYVDDDHAYDLVTRRSITGRQSSRKRKIFLYFLFMTG